MTSLPGWYVLDEDNRPVKVDDVATWGKFFEQPENRTVGLTQITSEITVSTTFLGMDHRIRIPGLPDGPPLLFETMIFGGPLDGDGCRYSSWDDAEIGHRAAVKKARKAIGEL